MIGEMTGRQTDRHTDRHRVYFTAVSFTAVCAVQIAGWASMSRKGRDRGASSVIMLPARAHRQTYNYIMVATSRTAQNVLCTEW